LEEQGGSSVCVEGVCTLQCSEDRADCNQDSSDGCEALLQSDVNHCGVCGQVCSDASGVAQCVDGECASFCATCEERAHADVTCGGSSCVWTCQQGWNDLDADLNQPNGSSSTGCEARTIHLIQRASNAADAGSSGLNLSLSIDDQGGIIGHRVLFVAVVSRETNDSRVPSRVTYGGQALTAVGSGAIEESRGLFSGLYYLDECGIQASNGNDTVRVETNIADWGGLAMEALLFDNVRQAIPSADSVTLTEAAKLTLSPGERALGSWYLGVVGAEITAPLSVDSPFGEDDSTVLVGSLLASAFSVFDAGTGAQSETYRWSSSNGNPYFAGYGVEVLPARDDAVCGL
ncbi:MAG: hypothetical protein MK135_11150, partial [Polyangiaceae bacterium]|nr:hypothetical protein [Polyangiaceae bacterium]